MQHKLCVLYLYERRKVLDNEIDKLRDELFSYAQDIDEKEREIKFLINDIRMLRVDLKKIPKKLAINVIEFIVLFSLYMYFMGAGLPQVMAEHYIYKIIIVVYFLGILKEIYQSIYHMKPDCVFKIKILTKENSLTYLIEEKEEQVELYERTILEEREKIRQIRERIAILEKEED